jgi:hypothetical protein
MSEELWTLLIAIASILLGIMLVVETSNMRLRGRGSAE